MKVFHYFTKRELLLWGASILLIIVSFVLWGKENYLNLIASLIGATSLIFMAKGNPFGQILVVLFSALYGFISYQIMYYGEMITYLGMTAPMAIFAFISWIRHPAKKGSSEVKINYLTKKEYGFAGILTLIVTICFYFILKAFDTANLVVSTISVFSSFFAVYLTCRRSEYYALAYACNDIILIVLWSMASVSDISYLSVTTCFVVFFLNDIYGFISWSKMKKRQMEEENHV